MHGPDLRVFDDLDALFYGAASEILERSRLKKGPFSIALSGGTTPEGLFRRMAAGDFAKQFNWKNIHFFWGDERMVPPTDPRSNFRMTQEALLKRIPISQANIHAVPTLGSSEDAAAAYEKELAAFFKTAPGRFPAFDVMLLGLGEDGHTASLFPNEPTLHETKRLCVPALTGAPEKGNPPVPRVTLTYPVINASRFVMFLISGTKKGEILKKVFSPEFKNIFPVQRVSPDEGEPAWFLDRAAADALS